MRKVTGGVAVLVVLWLGYWFAGYMLIRAAAKGVLAEQVAAGTLAPDAVATAGGFPVRFALQLENLQGTPAGSLQSWEVPEVALSLPAWAPWSAQAKLQEPVQYSDGLQDFTLTGTGVETAIAASPWPSLPLTHWHMAGEELILTSTLGWTLAAGSLRIDADRDADDASAYDLAAAILGLKPDAAFLAQLPGQTTLPPVLGDITLAGEVALTAPLDRAALIKAPGIARITLEALQAEWGTVLAEASGEVTAEASGLAEGRILIRVANWRELLPVLRASGAVSPGFAPTVERILAALAASSGDPAVLELPLTFAEGYMRLGPFPLGPAPVLR